MKLIKRQPVKKTLIFPGFLVLVIGLTAGWFYQDMQKQLNRPLDIHAPEVLSIKPGTSLLALAHHLGEKGWFDYPIYLQLEGRRQGVAGFIKAGEFLVEPGATALSLLDTVVSGQVIQRALTLLEGWTFKQIMTALHGNQFIKKTLNSTEPGYVMAEIGYPGYFPEGRFFPDTYYFPAGATDVEFLRRAFSRLEMVLEEEWDRRAPSLPYQSPYQALIMASLVEKETAIADERRKIAGVFVRRLEKNMKLQADPTVIYAMGKSYDGNIRRKDLSLDSPFNTYRYKGLPPTPIAAAGRAAIHAALQPEQGTELYFVATGDGRHHFSSTLNEHNRAVKKYQRE